MYWKRISSDMANIAFGDTKGTEENFMTVLLSSISEIIENHLDSGAIPNRVWTLHTVNGSRVKVHNFDPNIGNVLRTNFQHIDDGLIGLSIKREQDMPIYTDISIEKYPMYKRGWPACKSELIALVKNPIGNIVAVINIESSEPFDFLINSETPTTLQAELECLLAIATKHMYTILERQRLFEFSEKQRAIYSTLYERPIENQSNLRSYINSTFHLLETKLHILKGGIYLSENQENIQNQKNDGDMILEAQNIDYVVFPDAEIPKILTINNIDRYNFNDSPKTCPIDRFKKIFDESSSEKFFSSSGIREVYIQYRQLSKNMSIKPLSILTILLIEEKMTDDKKNEMINVFNLLSYFVMEYNTKLIAQNTSQSLEIFTSTNKISSNRYDINRTLELLSQNITKNTKARFTLIYLLGTEKNTLHQEKFFLAGSSISSLYVDSVRLPVKESLIGESFKNDEPVVVIDDYFDRISRTGMFDGFLKESELENPIIFITKLYDTHKGNIVGAIATFHQSVEVKNNKKNIIKSLNIYSSVVSELINNRISQAKEDLLKIGYKTLLDATFYLDKSKTIDETISTIQIKLNVFAPMLLKKFSEKVLFAIFGKEEVDGKEIYKLKTLDGLGVINDITAPEFRRGEGLTGNIVTQVNGELFVPYVNKIKLSNDTSPSGDFVTDPTCKLFWNSLINSDERFFYGREITVAFETYLLVLVGKQPQAYFPPIVYQLLNELTGEISRKHVEMTYRYHEKVNITPEKVMNSLKIKFKRDFGKEFTDEELVGVDQLFSDAFNKMSPDSSHPNEYKFSRIVTTLKSSARTLSTSTKESATFLVNADKIADFLAKFFGPMF